MITLHAAWSPGEIRVAAMAEGRLIDYAPWRPGAPDGVGDVHRGRIAGLVPAMAGAFVALDGAEGFLPDSEGAKDLTEGTILTVRVTRAPQGGKGPRLTARVDAAEDGPVGLRRRGRDPLHDLAIRYPEAAIVVDDLALAAALRPTLGARVTRVGQAFDDEIEAAVEQLSGTEVTLDGGVRLSIHPTPALTAIDVDGGAALAGRDGAARRHWAVNAAVLPDVARQIRLRGLSGAILVDLAGLKAKQRLALAPAFAAALATDPLRPRFLGFTALGLAEITRPRVRAPLHETMAGPLAAGLVALREMARASRADPGRRLGLAAAPAVVAALAADPVALADLARIAGWRLTPRSDPSLPANTWRIEAVHG